MEEAIVLPETAKLAKSKGFDYLVTSYYFKGNLRHTTLNNGYDFNSEKPYPNRLSAPTQSLLAKWIREVHNIDITVIPTKSQITEKFGYYFYVYNKITGYEYSSEPKNCPSGEVSHDTFEQAMEIGLQEALKLIKNE